jgi:hypothetical protein
MASNASTESFNTLFNTIGAEQTIAKSNRVNKSVQGVGGSLNSVLRQYRGLQGVGGSIGRATGMGNFMPRLGIAEGLLIGKSIFSGIKQYGITAVKAVGSFMGSTIGAIAAGVVAAVGSVLLVGDLMTMNDAQTFSEKVWAAIGNLRKTISNQWNNHQSEVNQAIRGHRLFIARSLQFAGEVLTLGTKTNFGQGLQSSEFETSVAARQLFAEDQNRMRADLERFLKMEGRIQDLDIQINRLEAAFPRFVEEKVMYVQQNQERLVNFLRERARK